ncbi:MAG TPA: anthrone oxygenase family protein [Vineibacter sp.]|nr:anthrone oxygenase family protein [Vineibacter sp.]
MIDHLFFVVTLLSALGSGLIAGIFFAFSTFVMAALARLPAPQGIAAMQSINVVVINPWFMAAFVGTAVLCLVLAVASLLTWHRPGTAWLLAGSLLYLVGVIVITRALNVPLNNALAAVDPASADGAALWADYVRTWTAWNHVRTVAPLVATVAFILALVKSPAP